MKDIRLILSLFILLLSQFTFAQDKTVIQQVNDVLSEMPANDAGLRDQLLNQLLDLKEDGLQELIQKLTPPGEGDDTPARYALESLAKYLTQSGKKAQRKAFSAKLASALSQDLDEEIKAFLIRRLQFTAEQPEVSALRVFIGDDYLSEASIRALVNIGGPEAETALAESLNQLSGAPRIMAVKALGQLESSKANAAIMKLVDGADPVLQRVCYYTLAQSAAPEVFKTLAEAAAAADYQYTPTHATQSFLDYGMQLRENGQLKPSTKVAKTVLKNATGVEQVAAKMTALQLMVIVQPQRANKLLKKAVKANDQTYRQAALALVKAIPGAAITTAWVSEMAKHRDPVKVEILQMLKDRGDAAAVPGILPYLKGSDDELKVAALKTILSLDKAKGIERTLEFLKANDHLAKAVKGVLLPLVGNQDLANLAAGFGEMPKGAKKTIIEIIAARKGVDYFDLIYPLAQQEDAALSRTALAALQDVSTAPKIDQLVNLLSKRDAPEEQAAIEMAMLVSLKDMDDLQQSRRKALDLLKNNASKKAILAISPELGGETLLEAVINEYQTGDHQAAAFEAMANWQGPAVAPVLFDMLDDPKAAAYRDQAFQGYLRAASSEELPVDQQLLLLRKAMPFAKGNAEKTAVLQAVGKTRTFLAFQFVADYLDNAQLQQTAAMAAMNIALPKPDETNGLYGKAINAGLEKVLAVMDGPESQYYKIDIQNYLDNMPDGIGFVPMFNGKDLGGWQGFVANPYKKTAMSSEELTEKQAEADEAMLETWSVRDNAIVFNGKGHNLVSAKEYGDFEMIVDWRITKGGDSGIYLRGTPQVQIWDTARVEVGAQVGSGGLYNNQKNERNPRVLADNAIGDWNTFRVTMIGEKVTVYLNGQLVVDEVPLENYWDRTQAIFPAGPIELQAHGTDLAFRDIYIREITSPDFSVKPEEKLEGFVSLFNGKNLDGWVGNKTAYQAKNGQIVIDPKGGGGGNLFTEKEYSDFNFRFEFQLTPGANNGLGIHAPLEGDAAYMGKELQILDNTAAIYAELKPYQYHGSVYGTIPARRGFLNPVGEWNEEEVIVKGSKIKIILNGTTIVDGDFLEASKDGTMDGRDHPGLKRTKGHIGFLGHGSELKFRNIRIKDLSE